jgi:hypothetical protein
MALAGVHDRPLADDMQPSIIDDQWTLTPRDQSTVNTTPADAGTAVYNLLHKSARNNTANLSVMNRVLDHVDYLAERIKLDDPATRLRTLWLMQTVVQPHMDTFIAALKTAMTAILGQEMEPTKHRLHDLVPKLLAKRTKKDFVEAINAATNKQAGVSTHWDHADQKVKLGPRPTQAQREMTDSIAKAIGEASRATKQAIQAGNRAQQQIATHFQQQQQHQQQQQQQQQQQPVEDRPGHTINPVTMPVNTGDGTNQFQSPSRGRGRGRGRGNGGGRGRGRGNNSRSD